MKISEYAEHLRRKGLPAEAVETRRALIEDLVDSLGGPGPGEEAAASVKPEVERFARRLIEERRNSLESFSALCDYADWLGNRPLYVALLELTDCHNAMEVLAGTVEAGMGGEVGGRIFSEPLPPLGAGEKERWAHTRMIMERMERRMSPAQIGRAWYQVQHGIPAAAWRESDRKEEEKYRQCRSIDEFLERRRRERDAMLTRLHDEGRLWYTIEIDDEVLELIRSDPEMEGGRRQGDSIYITKVPYQAIRYLHETDARMKRYYACHCPLVREAILQGQAISPQVCECSLGHASHYLAGLGREVKGEVLESAVKGDSRCRFVFHVGNVKKEST